MNTHRDLCNLAARWLLTQSTIQLVSVETKFYKGIADVIGITLRDNSLHKDIVVIEVKRTRADLLADLRKLKMLKYDQRTSKCYLAGTSEAFQMAKLTAQEAVKELTAKGVPGHWGILLLPTSGTEPPQVLRPAKRKEEAKPSTLRYLLIKMSLSYMYKYLGD